MYTVKSIIKCARATPVFLISKHGSESLAVSAFRAGIRDYFKASFSDRILLSSIKRHLPPNPRPTSTLKCLVNNAARTASGIVGNSAIMAKIKEKISQYAATDFTVLITGETGTGKELAAELIHQQSPRRQKAFICLNCAALPESLVESELFGYAKGAFTGAAVQKKGKFEQATGGTLFLDEIGDMSTTVQAKILRIIENKNVFPLSSQTAVDLDVRIISATNQDLEKLIEKRLFRKDLFYRLNVARVHLPPLRERKEDIPDLIASGLNQLNNRFGRKITNVAEEAMSSLIIYDWPGNVRELKNTLEVAFINCSNKKIRFADLPETFTKKINLSRGSPARDRDRLLVALSSTNWNKTMAAKKLNWSRMRVYRALKRYSITC